MEFKIKARFGGAILFSVETESLRLAVELAVKRSADLRGADLGGADLGGAYLGGADLGGADLRGAYLGGAYLRGAYLGGAYLRGADLGGADLGGAKLQAKDGANLLLVGDRPCLQIGPLGSRSDYLTAFLTDKGVYIKAGCFFDTLTVFKNAVCTTHGTTNHAIEYAAVSALIEYHAQCWTPEASNV